MNKYNKYTIRLNEESINIPILLTTKSDEMGILVGFDGDILQTDSLCNFTYTVSGKSVTIYNTSNKTNFPDATQMNFTVKWGDGSTESMDYGSQKTKIYNNVGNKKISVSFDSPWGKSSVKKEIYIDNTITTPNVFGELLIKIPYTDDEIIYRYLPQMDETSYDEPLTFIAIGTTRLDEIKTYGANSFTKMYEKGLIYTGITDNITYTGYTIDKLGYRDREDGITTVMGSTKHFEREEIQNKILTRNEFLLGFVEDMNIYSDVYVDRGKIGVMEMNLRLGDITNIRDLEVYGNGFFNIMKT